MSGDRYERKHWLAALGIVVLTLGVLTAMGQPFWCKVGDWTPWSWDIWSTHNSQHFADAYSFSHLQHGLIFLGALALLRDRISMGWKLAVALIVEAGWEILENTPMVIERYREATVSLEYSGDSVANSFADLLACWLGFEIARRLPWWGTLILFVVIEVVMVLTIKDSLLLNVLMLLYPLEAVREWQSA